MPDHPTEQVDRVARAICNAHRGKGAWDDFLEDGGRAHWREVARAALDAATLQCPTCGRTLNPHQRWCPKCLKWVVGERDQ